MTWLSASGEGEADLEGNDIRFVYIAAHGISWGIRMSEHNGKDSTATSYYSIKVTENTPKLVFVSGASRGIGKACAVALAQAGYDVAVSARTMTDGTALLDDGITPVPGGLDTTVAQIRAAGQEGHPIQMDLLDRQSVLHAADEAIEYFGRIDVLVNNAIYQGPGAMLTTEELDDINLNQLFEGNVFAQLGLTPFFLRLN